MDGFQINSGVRPGAGRENPEGVSMPADASLSVPNNVPLVVPANDSIHMEPNSGALSLARSLGNIDFGAISRRLELQRENKRKLREEADRAAGQAQAAQLLSATGSDLETLVRAGKIPASATPSFKLGASIAAAQSELMNLRKAINERNAANPNAPVFTDDPEFMQKFYQRLNGVRNEAVVKYFLEPMQALAADDAKRFAGSMDKENRNKFSGDAINAFTKSLELGDPLSGAFNNAVNVLKLGNQKTPEAMKALIESAGPQIIESSRKEDGSVDLAKAGRMLQEFGATKITAEGDGRLSMRYTEAYEALSRYVYGAVNRAASAEKAQNDANQLKAQDAYIDYLMDNFSQTSIEEQVRHGVKLGLDALTALNLSKGWNAAPGVKSQSELQTEKMDADIRFAYGDLTPDEQRKELEFINWQYKNGSITPGEYTKRAKILKEVMKEVDRAPIGGADRSRIKDTIYNQMPMVFGSQRSMQAALMGATQRYGIPATQTDAIRHKVADKLTDVAMSWIMSQPSFSTYKEALNNVSVDQGAPGRIIGRLAEQFLTANAPALSTLVPRALASANPDSALGTLRLTTPPANATKPVHKRVVPAPARPARPPAKVRPTTAPDITRDVRIVNKATSDIMNPKSPIFQWYASYVRMKRPRLTDDQIKQRLIMLGPNGIKQLQVLFNKEHGYGK